MVRRDECTCLCHRMSGVVHVAACCDGDLPDFKLNVPFRYCKWCKRNAIPDDRQTCGTIECTQAFIASQRR